LLKTTGSCKTIAQLENEISERTEDCAFALQLAPSRQGGSLFIMGSWNLV